MRIAATVFTAKRSNKFLVLHKEGMLVHNRPPPTARVRGMPAILGARPALRRPGPPTRRPWSWRKMAGKGRRHALDGAPGIPREQTRAQTLDSRAL